MNLRPTTNPPLSLSAWLRFGLVARLLSDCGPAPSILEIGCGRGAMAARFATQFEYRGFEPDGGSFVVSEQRLHSIGRGVVHNRPLPTVPDRTYDVIVAFEVLEHMEDDGDALRTWYQWVKPGGFVLLSVPAHAGRFGSCDNAVGHYRRYDRDDLLTALSSAGFEVGPLWAYGFPLGYALEGIRNLLARRLRSGTIEERTSASGRLFQPRRWQGAMTRLLSGPFRFLQLPFVNTNLGTGFVVLANRPS